jgi:pimeloyl-ACP methyl ester carboxylesterase
MVVLPRVTCWPGGAGRPPKAAAGPAATDVRIDEAGHWPHEEEPDAVSRAIARGIE